MAALNFDRSQSIRRGDWCNEPSPINLLLANVLRVEATYGLYLEMRRTRAIWIRLVQLHTAWRSWSMLMQGAKYAVLLCLATVEMFFISLARRTKRWTWFCFTFFFSCSGFLTRVRMVSTSVAEAPLDCAVWRSAKKKKSKEKKTKPIIIV